MIRAIIALLYLFLATSALAQSPAPVQLAWQHSTDNVAVTGYNIYRDGKKIGSSPTTSYTDATVAPTTQYSYTVSAFDAAGNESDTSAAYIIKTGTIIILPPGGSDVTFTPLTLYYVDPISGSDGAAGTFAAPWKTPNHSVHCGDVLLVKPGTYTSLAFGVAGVGTNGVSGPWGAVSNCPSTTGGIDGQGGIYFAIALCAGSDLESCLISDSGDNNVLMTSSNWAMEGFKSTATGGGFSFGICACISGSTLTHHNAFINNISYNSSLGFWAGDDAINHSNPGNGPDYVAFVGNISQNSAQLAQSGGFICSASMVFVGPSYVDTVAQTHYYMYGNFSYNNLQTCNSDVESMMFDTLDAHGSTGQGVMQNNILVMSSRFAMQVFYQDTFSVAGQKIYILNNTSYAGNNGTLINGGNYGDLNLQNNQSVPDQPTSVKVQNNIFKTNTSGNNGGSVFAALNGGVGGVGITTLGSTGNENIFNGVSAQNVTAFDGNNTGTNFTNDPALTNVTDLLASRIGVPNCTGWDNTTACMGWQASMGSLTVPSLISDITATCGANCAGKGYQRPSKICGPITAPDGTALYPNWLKGIVYLHASGYVNGATITEKVGLVTKPCNM